MKKQATGLSGLAMSIEASATKSAATERAATDTPNQPKPPAKTKTNTADKKSVLIRLAPDVHKKLKIYAATEETSIQKSIDQAIALFLDEKGLSD